MKMGETDKPFRPLPDGLYIGMSNIEGNGLFTYEPMDKGLELGISHVTYLPRQIYLDLCISL